MQFKKILIIGGTGSWGKELTKKLLEEKETEIIIFSRNEYLQVLMQREFNDAKDRIKYVIGDVRSYESVNNTISFYKPDLIYSLAALKHVTVCEEQFDEAIKTNINGTQNIVKSCIKNKISRMVLVSTDKACNPINLYGMTKAVAEKIVINSNLKTTDTDFVCVRAGNVVGSNGSLIPLLEQQIKEKKEITITDPNMTRFLMTLPDAINLLITASQKAKRGETWVMNMMSFKISQIVDYFKEKYPDTFVTKVIGRRIGEKVHEDLISSNEIYRTVNYHNGFSVILPENSKDIQSNVKFPISSSTYISYSDDLSKILKKAGY